MKAAKIEDHWRHLYEKEYPKRIERFSYNAVPALGTSEVGFHGGLTAICGANGVGKSTLLRSIYCCLLHPDHADYGSVKQRILGGSLTSDIVVEGQQVFVSKDMENDDEDGNDPLEIEVNWLEPGRDCPEILHRYAITPNVQDLWEAIEPRLLTEDELEIVSFLVGRKYDKVAMYEIEGAFDRDAIPFFELESHGVTYSSQTMGLGEFSLFYIYWALSSQKSTSMLLLEEPECFISPRSQIAVMDYIAKLSDERKIWTIISTHSPHVLSKIPIEHIRLLMSDPADSTVVIPQDPYQYLSSLGLSHIKQGMIYVEDHASREFLRNGLSIFSREVLASFYIQEAGSESEVIELLRRLPAEKYSILFIGLLDGDMRSREIGADLKWPCLFLPGDSPPDKLLRDHAYSEPARLAEQLGLDKDAIRNELANFEGVDFHDWIYQFSKAFGMTSDQLFSHMMVTWLSLEANEMLMKDMTNELQQAIGELL